MLAKGVAVSQDEIDAIRKLLAAKPRPVGWAERRQRLDEVGSLWPVAGDVSLEAVNCDGVPGEWSLAPGSDRSRVLIFFHGGGYCSGSILSHRRMVTEAGRAARMRYLTDRWANRLEKQPRVKILTSRLANQSWGLANISLEGIDAGKAYETLWAKYRIITAAIKHAEYQGLRITPNIYSTLEEIDTFGDAIESMLKNGVGTA